LAEAQHKADTYQGCLAEKGGLTNESVWAECAREEDGGAQAEARPTAPAQDTPPVELPQPETMIVFVPADSAELAVYQRLAGQFQKDHPDLGVNIQRPDYSLGSGLTARAGQADCFALYPDVDSEKSRAAVLSLDPFVDADPEFDLSDLDFVDSFRYEGQLWGLPLEVFPKVVVYNKSLFDASGVPYPALDWTLDDFLDTAIALTGDGSAQYGFISGMLETTDLMFFLEQQGAPLIDENSDPVDFLFDASATQAAMQWCVDLDQAHQVKPTFKADWRMRAADAFDQQVAMILNGRAAMWTSYAEPGLDYPFEDEIEVGIAPLPQGPGRVGDYQLRGYYISAQAEHPQGCWEWIKFLSGQTEQLEGMPARRSLAEAESYRLKVGEEKTMVLQQAFANADRITAFMDHDRPGWTGKPLLWLAQAFDAAVEGELSVDAALAEAQHKADAYRDCLAAQDGFDDGAAWEACAAEVEATWGP
jgi:multiple sugar transport system substrate-binding protein